jgi:pimeloyl-ACP methyl ester carboxylesterase
LPYAKIDKLDIYYEDIGKGYPLVLLHPWPTDHAMWMFQFPVFSESYRIIAPDSRGLGASSKPHSGYSLKRLSNDVNELLEQLGIERAFIVGNSLGGAVAEKFCIDHPDKVQATVWIGAPTFPLDDMTVEMDGKSIPFLDYYLDALKSGYLNFWDSVWKPTMQYQYHESFVRTYIGDYLIRYLFEERYARLNAGDAHGVIGALNGLRKESSLDKDLAALDIPSAVVAGDGDDTLPYCKLQHAAVPKSELFILKDSGHFCYMDQAENFNRFLWDFLERNAPLSNAI